MNSTFLRLKAQYRYSVILLKQLVITDFRLRYQNSVLGYLWSLLRPLALFVILYIVFVRFLNLGSGIPHYPVYLLLGIVLWNYFVEATLGGVTSIVARGDLLRKINFPRYVIVLSGSFSALINLILNLVVVAIFILLTGVTLSAKFIVVIPLIGELFVFALAIAFFLSAVFVRFRDVSYIWEVVIQGAFYATPVLYPLSKVPVVAGKILMVNPVAQIIQDIRYLSVTTKTQTIATVYGNQYVRFIPISITIVVAVVAVVYFRSRSRFFAEDV